VHATAKDKSKDVKKKSFLWTQNVYVFIKYISYLWCRLYEVSFQKNSSPG